MEIKMSASPDLSLIEYLEYLWQVYATGGPHGGGRGFSFYGKMKFQHASVCIQYFEYYGRAGEVGKMGISSL